MVAVTPAENNVLRSSKQEVKAIPSNFSLFSGNKSSNAKAQDQLIDGAKLQQMIDGMNYRLMHATHPIYRNNKHHADNGFMTEHLTAKLTELERAYPASESAHQSVSNAKRVALHKIRRELEGNEPEFAENNFSTFHSRLSLGYTNLVRIFWVFVRFDLNEFIHVFKQLCTCMALVDEAQLMSFLDHANQTLWILSVALFGLRLAIELMLAAKHIFNPQTELEKSMTMGQRAAAEWHKRFSDCLNYITWGMVNALTNFPQWFGIPVWTCFPITAGVLLFDVWLAYRKHEEEKRQIKAALSLVAIDKASIIETLKLTEFDKELLQEAPQHALVKLSTLIENERDAKRLKQLQELNVYLQEEAALRQRMKTANAIFHWREKSALVVCGAFAMSVLATLAATTAAFPPLAPLVIGVALVAIAWHSYNEQRECRENNEHFRFMDYLNKHKKALALSAAFTASVLITAALCPPATMLICYFAVSIGIVGYYKEETLPFIEKCSYKTYKDYRQLQQEATNPADKEKFKALAERTRFRLCVDIAAWAILPPVLIGSLAVCWPLTIVAAGLIVGYAAYLFYRHQQSKTEESVQAIEQKEDKDPEANIKGRRFQLFRQHGSTNTKTSKKAHEIEMVSTSASSPASSESDSSIGRLFSSPVGSPV